MKGLTATFLVIGLLITACGDSKVATLRIAVPSRPTSEILMLAKERELLEQAGVVVDLVRFPSLKTCMDGFMTGDFDGLCCTGVELLLLTQEGHHLKAVMILGYSNGMDALVTSKEIPGLARLRGRQVGVQLGTSAEYILKRALQKGYMGTSDIEIVNLPVDRIEEELVVGRLDAGILDEPALGRVLENEGLHILFSSEHLGHEVVDLLCLKESVIEDKPQDCSKLVQSYFDALAHWSTHTADDEDYMAGQEGMERGMFRKSIGRTKIARIDDNVRMLGGKDELGPLNGILEQVSKNLFDCDMLGVSQNTELIVDSRLVASMGTP